MASEGKPALLSADDLPPVRIANPEGRSLFLLLGDHAGNGIPRSLSGLGLPESELQRHIALDIGVSRLGRALASALDAVFVEQRYSRLVVDCNRDTASAEGIAAVSDGTTIPANATVAAGARESRYREVFHPYHNAIAALLDARAAKGEPVILVSLHSFTPVLAGERRPWEIGVLHDGGDTGFALALLARLRAGGGTIGDNQPYRMDATDYTVPRHAYPRLLPYAELEIRQDRLATHAGIARVARLLSQALVLAADDVGWSSPSTGLMSST